MIWHWFWNTQCVEHPDASIRAFAFYSFSLILMVIAGLNLGSMKEYIPQAWEVVITYHVAMPLLAWVWMIEAYVYTLRRKLAYPPSPAPERFTSVDCIILGCLVPIVVILMLTISLPVLGFCLCQSFAEALFGDKDDATA